MNKELVAAILTVADALLHPNQGRIMNLRTFDRYESFLRRLSGEAEEEAE